MNAARKRAIPGLLRHFSSVAKSGLILALVTAVIATGCGDRPESASDRAARDGMKADIDAVSEQTRDDPAARIDPFDIGPVAEDEAGRMHQVMRQYLNAAFQVRNDYLAELEAMGWSGILDADRLKADAGMVESKRLVAEARAAMARAETGSVAALKSIPGLIEAAPITAANKREMLKGYEGSLAKGLADIRGAYALESETLDQFAGMVELLERVEWDVDQSQIVFVHDVDVETYNAHFHRITALTEEIAARQKQGLEQARDKLSGAGN